MSRIIILGPKDRKHPKFASAINTTSASRDWAIELSPFRLGPVRLPDGRVSMKMENAWQYSKVYGTLGHLDSHEMPNDRYKEWSDKGFSSPRAQRFPAGRGSVPAFSCYGPQRLGYLEARTLLYAPLYAACVQQTSAFTRLKKMYASQPEIALFDFDGYFSKTRDWLEYLMDPNMIMGHSFVLGMMLEDKLDETLAYAREILKLQEIKYDMIPNRQSPQFPVRCMIPRRKKNYKLSDRVK